MENANPDSTTVTVAIIQLAYGVPSFFLMIAFLIFLGCGKAYNPSFYRLVQLDLFTVSQLPPTLHFSNHSEHHPLRQHLDFHPNRQASVWSSASKRAGAVASWPANLGCILDRLVHAHAVSVGGGVELASDHIGGLAHEI